MVRLCRASILVFPLLFHVSCSLVVLHNIFIHFICQKDMNHFSVAHSTHPSYHFCANGTPKKKFSESKRSSWFKLWISGASMSITLSLNTPTKGLIGRSYMALKIKLSSKNFFVFSRHFTYS